MKHGGFTSLASRYARYLPGWAPQLATAILRLLGRDAADVGARTGTWTRILEKRGTCSAAENNSNNDERGQGLETSKGIGVTWAEGTPDATGVVSGSVDLLPVASSFHWPIFVSYLEERHSARQTRAQYLSAWRWVNDLQVRLGLENFSKFQNFDCERTHGLPRIEIAFFTRV